MFLFTSGSKENIGFANNENDDTTITLEAFQGDSALIQTVNELNDLKQYSMQDISI